MGKIFKWMLILAAVFAISRFGVIQVKHVFKLGNNLSSSADSFSEANVIKAGEYFYDRGFAEYYGLANITYGSKFPNDGSAGMTKDKWIYTHYPPLPEILGGVLTNIFGKDNIPLYRLLPISITLLALFIFFVSYSRLFNLWAGVAITIMLLLPPLIGEMAHGLYYQGYSLALFLITCAIVNFIEAKLIGLSVGLIGIGCISFLQGWLSFDYFFVSSFGFIPYVIAVRLFTKESFRFTGRLGLATVSGFTLAHSIHFCQVWAYHQSFKIAFKDIFSEAVTRSVGTFVDGTKVPFIDTVVKYLTKYIHQKEFFGIYLICAAISVVLLLAVINLISKSPRNCVNRNVLFSSTVAIIVSLGWVFAMLQHAAIHTIFIPRHFVVLYLTMSVVIIQISAELLSAVTTSTGFKSNDEAAKNF